MRRAVCTNLTPAEAWCWVVWMLHREMRALDAVWPPVAGNDELARAIERQADAFMARATALDAGEDLWRRALDKWDAAAEAHR